MSEHFGGRQGGKNDFIVGRRNMVKFWSNPNKVDGKPETHICTGYLLGPGLTTFIQQHLSHYAGTVLALSSAACTVTTRIGDHMYMCWMFRVFCSKQRAIFFRSRDWSAFIF